jgi:formylglycine-generating enzyme required for sulfatase activity/serine/threonine protein phosphatase PrpC
MASEALYAVEAWSRTDPGRANRHNEDCIGSHVPGDSRELLRNGQLYVLADGTGGPGAGDVVSHYAVQKVLHVYYTSNEPDLAERLAGAFRAANADVYEYAQAQTGRRLGATLLAAIIAGRRLIIANAGQARAYLARGDKIWRITDEYSAVDETLEGDAASKAFARHDALTRSLGSRPEVVVDTYEGEVRSGDVVLLCSDGLISHVNDDEEIRRVLTGAPPEMASAQLIHLANLRGGSDNISVIVLRVGEERAVRAIQPPAAEVGSPHRPAMRARSPRLRSPADLVRALRSLWERVGERRFEMARVARPLQERLQDRGRGSLVIGIGVLAAALLVGGVVFSVGRMQAARRQHRLAEAQSTQGTEAAFAAQDETLAAVSPGRLTRVAPSDASGTPSAAGTTPAAVSGDRPSENALLVEAGPFLYGSRPEDLAAALELCRQHAVQPETGCKETYFSDSSPQVTVSLDAFYIGRTEVTNAEYAACVEAGACQEPILIQKSRQQGTQVAPVSDIGLTYPVVGISWQQAADYCVFAGGRLPSEAEWEKAASWGPEAAPDQPGGKWVWPWGNEWVAEYANTNIGGQAGPMPVGSLGDESASRYGALDMAGNVSEWVADWYDPAYYQALEVNPRDNPKGPAGPGEQRVHRGGSFADAPAFVRTTHRLSAAPDDGYSTVGFRCAWDAGESR